MDTISRSGKDPTTPTLWRNRSFAVLALAQFISINGRCIAYVALPWFVLSTTGSAGQMVLVLLAESIPTAIFGLPSGALVDRLNLKRLMVFLDFAAAGFTLVVPVMAYFGQLQFWMILVTSALGGISIVPYLGARMALIPALVGEDEQTLTKANSVMQFTIQASIILGPMLGGLLIGVMGNTNVLFLDSASVFICGLMLAFGVVFRPKDKQTKQDEGWLDELKAGLGFIRHNQLIRTAIFMGWMLNFGLSMLVDAAFPVFVKNVLHGSPTDLGLLIGTYGIGATVGTVVYSLVASRIKWGRNVVIGVMLAGMVLPIWIPPLMPFYVPTFVAMCVSAFFDGPLGVVIQTIMQTDTPPEIRGRVFSAFTALNWMGMPVGLMVAGPLLQLYGSLVVMWVVAAILTVATVGMLLSPAMRRPQVSPETEVVID